MLTYTINLYRNAYRGLSKNSWYLSIVMLVNRSGTMVIPFLSIYCVQQLHFTIVQAGTIMALFGVGALLGAFAGGKLVDKIGFYDLQIGALFSGGLLFMLLGFQHTFITMAAGSFILSFCNESFRPANSTAITHYSSDDNKTRSYSLNRMAINLGWAVGGALGGFLAAINYHLLFWVDGCSNIMAAILLLILMPRGKIVRSINTSPETDKKTSPYRDKIYLAFIFLSTLFAMCFFQFMTMQPVFFKLEWHLTERLIGAVMALNGILVAMFEMIIVHKLEGRKHGLTYINWGLGVGCVAYLLLNLLPPALLSAVVAIVLITLTEIMCMPFMNSFWVSRASSHNRGQYAALYSMSWSAAQILAPFLGGNVIFFGGFKLLWWLLAGVSALTAFGFWRLYLVVKPTLTE